MSPFIRRYAKYLNEKAMSYRTVAFDFCKMKRGKEEGTIRSMNAEKLLKTLPVLQGQLDALLEFDCSANDLTNGQFLIEPLKRTRLIHNVSLQVSLVCASHCCSATLSGCLPATMTASLICWRNTLT